MPYHAYIINIRSNNYRLKDRLKTSLYYVKTVSLN
ncbi:MULTISPECIES: hypothetical protein [Thermoanaerobacter]|nr:MULTISPECIES: hypothetical protein [Thermoanaerobacter]